MTTAWNVLPNSVALKRAYFGTELQAGVPVAPTFRVYADLSLMRTRSLADRPEFTGTFFPDHTPVFGPWEISGTMSSPLSYEDLAIYTRYVLQGGGTGVTDAEATPGYAYTRRPHATALDIDAATIEGGTPNLPWTASGVIFPEFTIRGDIDNAANAWEWSSPINGVSRDLKTGVSDTATGGTTLTVVKTLAAWVVNAYAGAYVTMTGGTAANIGHSRLIASNTADTLTVSQAFPAAVVAADTFSIGALFTAGVGDRSREIIEASGTQLFIDPAGGTLGTTEVENRFISFEVTYNSGMSTYKRFMENVSGFSAKPDMGMRRVTGQITMEFDRRDEYDDFVAGLGNQIRFYKEGSVIDAGAGTNKYAQIDVYNAIWSQHTEAERNSNITQTLGFTGFYDAGEGVPFEVEVVNTLATLP